MDLVFLEKKIPRII